MLSLACGQPGGEAVHRGHELPREALQHLHPLWELPVLRQRGRHGLRLEHRHRSDPLIIITIISIYIPAADPPTSLSLSLSQETSWRCTRSWVSPPRCTGSAFTPTKTWWPSVPSDRNSWSTSTCTTAQVRAHAHAHTHTHDQSYLCSLSSPKVITSDSFSSFCSLFQAEGAAYLKLFDPGLFSL